MGNFAIAQPAILTNDPSEQKHRRRLQAAWILLLGLVSAFFAYGFDYYKLS